MNENNDLSNIRQESCYETEGEQSKLEEHTITEPNSICQVFEVESKTINKNTMTLPPNTDLNKRDKDVPL